MYLLFLDESGTHGGSHAFVLGGLAVHENDAARFQKMLDDLVIAGLGRVPVNLEEYELHAGEMRNAKKPPLSATAPPQRLSVWASVERAVRLRILSDAYTAISTFTPSDQKQPVWLFGSVMDSRFHSGESQLARERYSYEVVLNKFDLMLKKAGTRTGNLNRGLVIHDRRVVAERDIQSWTTQWRAAAGDIGQLRNLADVPLFADSRASRMLQAADLVSYALYRRYADPADVSYFVSLWPLFHREDGHLHGLVHFTPGYGQGACACESCSSRL